MSKQRGCECEVCKCNPCKNLKKTHTPVFTCPISRTDPRPCDCKVCKCDPCSDPAVKKRRSSCECEICKCNPCIKDPKKQVPRKKPVPVCDCQTCYCDPCRDINRAKRYGPTCDSDQCRCNPCKDPKKAGKKGMPPGAKCGCETHGAKCTCKGGACSVPCENTEIQNVEKPKKVEFPIEVLNPRKQDTDDIDPTENSLKGSICESLICKCSPCDDPDKVPCICSICKCLPQTKV